MRKQRFMSWSLRLMSLLILALFGLQIKAAVNPPELRCLSVDSIGRTTITWIPPVDPSNEFVNYDIFISANKNGPYASNSASGLATTTFTDITNDASLTSYYYYVQTVYDDGSGPTSSISSDTGRTILLNFSAVTDSTNTIEWNPIFDPNIVSNLGIYSVFHRIGSTGPYANIGSTNFGTETFDDAFKVCSDTLFYQVEISDASGCVSKSAILSDVFEDNTPPATPYFDSITVNRTTKEVNLGWSPSSSLDTYGYLVFYWEKSTSSYIFRDTVFGRTNTNYLETLAAIDPTKEWEQYTVASFDSCFDPLANTSASANPQKTMFLEIIPNNCENTVTLNWTPYINWDDLERYEVLVSVNGGPVRVATTISKSETSFTHEKTNELAIYCYSIRAVNTFGTRTSLSNEKCSIANALVMPSKQYFKEISVENNKDIKVVSLTDTTLPASQYALYRSIESHSNFFEVSRIPFENKSIIELKDTEVKVDQTAYNYRIGILDTCGSLMFISKESSSIYLKGEMKDDSLTVNLNWNKYTSWDSVLSGVEKYIIYQVVDGNRVAIDSVDRFTTNFEYVMEHDIEMGANFCFEVLAIEADGNRYNMHDSAISNQVCFTRNLRVFVPNAFRPSGVNSVFNPVIGFGDVSSYRMVIYDRWGGAVYETVDITQGWDGTIDGSAAEFGAYVYHIQVSNFTGASYSKNGTFVLLR